MAIGGLVEIVVIGGVLYYLFTTGTLDNIIQSVIPKAGAPSSGGSQYSGSNARPYKAPATSHTAGYSSGGGKGSYGSGGYDPGWYTSGSNIGNAGHHHCKKGQPDCWCTDPNLCSKGGVLPSAPGQCKPQWGIRSFLGPGGNYPTTVAGNHPELCPPGTT